MTNFNKTGVKVNAAEQNPAKRMLIVEQETMIREDMQVVLFIFFVVYSVTP